MATGAWVTAQAPARLNYAFWWTALVEMIHAGFKKLAFNRHPDPGGEANYFTVYVNDTA